MLSEGRKFQKEVIPAALQGNDVFGVSPPGIGKTVSFVLPISHALLETRPNLTPFFALVLHSTRRLAFHTADDFRNLGSQFGVKCAIIAQENRKEHESILNSEQPRIIVGRPDLILYHLKHTQGFSLALASLKYLVHTMLSVCLRNPVKNDWYWYTLSNVVQRFFWRLGFRAIPIMRYMSQAKKLRSLNAFKSGEYNILLCSDFLSKGLDIPAVDMVINYNIPRYPKDYIYRVGWTAAHVNVAISFVSPDERRHFNMIEKHIGKKLPLYPAPFEEVLLLEGRVVEAEKYAQEEMKELGWMSGGYLEKEEAPRRSGASTLYSTKQHKGNKGLLRSCTERSSSSSHKKSLSRFSGSSGVQDLASPRKSDEDNDTHIGFECETDSEAWVFKDITGNSSDYDGLE
ncbi:DEAD-box ATP-dependent RNA helicase-like protein [Medicago truncatula]|uniref:DEAD-box ATP-dependent RNA helicase-like protein n=1 Tax=Medicago truncatula TaxID=3880 RepID=A0A072VNN0_MEDTR|nr:DEAD-box ATP-dependent RNA helicase-like protein [Medicago truncatula]